MKSLRLVTAICLLSIFFFACKKNDESSPSPAKTRLTRYTETLNPGTNISVSNSYNIAYDQDNKIVSITNSLDPGTKFIFDHFPDGFNFDIYASGNLVIRQNVLMSGNMIDSTIQHNNEGDTTTEKYIYWAGGMLKWLMQYDITPYGPQLTNVTEYTYGANNALITEHDYHSTTVYTYDREEINNLNLYPLYVNRSKRLPSSVTFISGNVTVTSKHKYTFDAEKRLIKDEIDISTGESIEKKFTYE